MSCDRRKDIAAVECLADGVQKETLILDPIRRSSRAVGMALEDIRQYTVVRRDEHVFMRCRRHGTPCRSDAGINHGLGVPNAFYHFAFEAGSEAGLDEMRNALIARGVEVSDVVDHDWAKSIYFKDPNGVQLEYCCFTRNLNADDARMQERAEISIRRLGLTGAGSPTPVGSAKAG